MHLPIDQTTRRQGRMPHELAMVNLLGFNLLLCAGILASTMARQGSTLEHYKLWLILVPLVLSLAVMAYSFRRTIRAVDTAPWFVATQWRIAMRRHRILLIAYGVVAVLMALGWLLSRTNPQLQDVMFVALVRVAVAPLLVTVMVLAVLESSALFQTISGEVPDRVVARHPPPAD